MERALGYVLGNISHDVKADIHSFPNVELKSFICGIIMEKNIQRTSKQNRNKEIIKLVLLAVAQRSSQHSCMFPAVAVSCGFDTCFTV